MIIPVLAEQLQALLAEDDCPIVITPVVRHESQTIEGFGSTLSVSQSPPGLQASLDQCFRLYVVTLMAR